MGKPLSQNARRKKLSEIWNDEWKFCGCGNPEIVLVMVRDVLRTLREWSDEVSGARERENELLTGGSGLLVRYWLDTGSVGLTEHGGAVWGHWLTEKGEAVLGFLETCSVEDFEDFDDHDPDEIEEV